MYELFKDFAGPIATVVVAVFVGLITWRYNKKQTEIAQEKLKIDLFERRYAIYVAAREMLEFLVSASPSEISYDPIREWMTRIREAPFFFGSDVTSFLEHIQAMVENLLGKIDWQEAHSENPGDIAEKIHELQNIMSTELLKLPREFQKELGFKRFV
jgi:hypothetical protein